MYRALNRKLLRRTSGPCGRRSKCGREIANFEFRNSNLQKVKLQYPILRDPRCRDATNHRMCAKDRARFGSGRGRLERRPRSVDRCEVESLLPAGDGTDAARLVAVCPQIRHPTSEIRHSRTSSSGFRPDDAYPALPVIRHSLLPPQQQFAPASVPISPVPVKAARIIRFARRAVLQEWFRPSRVELRYRVDVLPNRESKVSSAVWDYRQK